MSLAGQIFFGTIGLAVFFWLWSGICGFKDDMKNSYKKYGDEPAIPEEDRCKTTHETFPLISLFLVVAAIFYLVALQNPDDTRKAVNKVTHSVLSVK